MKKRKRKEQVDLTQPDGGEEDEQRWDGRYGSAWWTPIFDDMVNLNLWRHGEHRSPSLSPLSLSLAFLWWEEQMMLLEGSGGEKEIKEGG